MQHKPQDLVQSAGAEFDPDADRLREECGVFGIFGHPDAAAITALGLHALQHRGQEAAGIVSFDGKRFHSERRLGLVGDAFARREVIDRLPGNAAIGHVRYSTTGETVLRNVQPLFAELEGGGFAIGHNGNLTNGIALRKNLVHEGAMMQSTTDTEVILHLVARARRNRFIDRFIEGLRQLEGAYAFVGLTNKKLVGARDPLGIRPLVIGKLDGCPILASETCALDIIGAQYVRDVENGEVVIFDEDGAQSHKPFPPMAARPCIFEYIYFSRPDSIVGGRNVYDVRKGMGAELAREAPAQADVVVPVPDSGVPAALGYAQQSGIPYELGIIRNHYVGRTFIQPTQAIRDQGVRMKHSANRAVVSGKRIVLIDDSIVRGTTSRKIVQMMRDAGAKQVHFRIASPPITHPDYYGIDTPERDKLLAATHDLEGMRKFIGADSLAFLSVDGIYRAMGLPGRDPCGRNSPTIASPAIIRRRSPTWPRKRPARGNYRCSPKPSRLSHRRYPMSKPLSDRIALVTGASRGIGAALALQLAEAGAHVVAVARTVGGLEELDDKIKAAGGSATLVPLDMKDSDGIARLALALNERYGRLDVLAGNAGVLGPLSPLGHIEPKDWDNLFAVNVTANWQLIRCMDPLLKSAPAGRAVFLTSAVAYKGRAYWGPYAASKAALDALVRAYAAESETTKVCANLFAPGPTRTRMYLGAFPGIDPMTLPTPEEVAKSIVPLCLPDCVESGKIYEFRTGKFLEFRAPA